MIKRGDPRAAVERLKDATRRYPDDRGLVLQLARAYLLEDNLFWAERTLLGAVEKWPDDAGLRAWLAAVHLRQGDPDLVEDDLAAALQPDEDPLRTRWLLLKASRARLRHPAARDSVVASKKEGLVNGVEETPTLFIDGRRWVGDLELEELVSAVEEAAARARGKLCGSE